MKYFKMKSILMFIIIALIANLLSSLQLTAEENKVVILCFDGVDAGMTRNYMEEGLLPNMKALADKGTFSNMATTNPPQTPVSWAAFTTGWHPGKTQIFDFLKRDAGSYLPTYCMVTLTSNKLFFGELNPWIFGLLGALILFIIVYLILRFTTKKKKLSLFVSLGAFVAAFIIVFLLVRAWIPVEIAGAINNRKGTPFWDVLNNHDIKTKVFNIPVTFPATGVKNGKLLSGLGVPDVTGSIGKPAYYTTDEKFKPATGEFTVAFNHLHLSSDGIYYTYVYGPDRKNLRFLNEEGKEEEIDLQSLGYLNEEEETKSSPEYMFNNDVILIPEEKNEPIGIPMKLTVNIKEKQVTIEIQGNSQTIKEGGWSDWYELRFKITPALTFVGIGRFSVQEVSPNLKLYCSPIQFHPKYAPIAISAPKNWAAKLFDRYGIYKTLGWGVDTWSYQEDLISPASFLEEAYYSRGLKEAMLYDSLENFDHDVHVQYFEYTDRIQHLFWRLIDEGHPYYDSKLAMVYSKSIRECYKDMDRIVGEVMKRINDKTDLYVISDHGFVSWRRAINYNTWLHENGFLVFKEGISSDKRDMELDDLFQKKSDNFWPNVDWSKTTAYALGIGNIYLNVAGREPHGILDGEEEYNRVRDEIIKLMPQTVDPDTGMKPIVNVYKREDIWDSFDPKITPDLRVTTNEYYRVSWQSTLGNTPKTLYYDVKSNWSGDHCSADPSLVDGIFFSSKKIKKASKPKLVDFLPTLLEMYGINPEEYSPSGVNLYK